MQVENQFVSVIVITYNSAKFVLETLESIKEQSYQNIELIISDDCSTDNTLEICRNWIAENKDRFLHTELITVDKNKGIPANFNRGVKATNGDWIKLIAGDDALLPNCIADNMRYIKINPDINVLFSFNKVYRNTFNEDNFLRLNPIGYPNFFSSNISSQDQYKILLIGNRIPFTPSSFFNKKVLLKIGPLEEDFYSEDYQLFLKLTKNGHRLHFMEKETVMYRQHDEASNNVIQEYIVKPHFFKTENFRRRFIYPNIAIESRLSQKYSWIVNQIFRIKILNKNTKINHFIYYLINIVFNPFKYILYFKSMGKQQ